MAWNIITRYNEETVATTSEVYSITDREIPMGYLMDENVRREVNLNSAALLRNRKSRMIMSSVEVVRWE